MSPDDRAVVARDPALTGLDVVLDDDRLTVRARAGWRAGPVPDRLTVRYLRYKPGTQVLAAVDVDGADGRRTMLLAATAGTATAKLAKLRRAAAERGVAPAYVDPDRPLVVLPLTADRRLHRLGGRGGVLDRVTARLPELAGAEVEVLSYKPHRRLVVRLDVAGLPRAVVKVHEPGAFPAIRDGLTWAQSAADSGLAVPRLAAVDERCATAVTWWYPGVALDQQEPDRQRATLRGIGKLLGRLHRRDGTRLPHREQPGPGATLRTLQALRPDLVPDARRLLEEAPPRPGERTPVHGDLSADQVVHGPDGVGLIDLDRLGFGPPAADLASWIAADLVTRPTGAALQLPDALLEGYRSVGGPADVADVVACLPGQVVRRLGEPFRLRRPGWSTQTEAMVERVTSATAGDRPRS